MKTIQGDKAKLKAARLKEITTKSIELSNLIEQHQLELYKLAEEAMKLEKEYEEVHNVE